MRSSSTLQSEVQMGSTVKKNLERRQQQQAQQKRISTERKERRLSNQNADPYGIGTY
jgi:N-acyl-D-aspartate/D-glutamate deacylase